MNCLSLFNVSFRPIFLTSRPLISKSRQLVTWLQLKEKGRSTSWIPKSELLDLITITHVLERDLIPIIRCKLRDFESIWSKNQKAKISSCRSWTIGGTSRGNLYTSGWYSGYYVWIEKNRKKIFGSQLMHSPIQEILLDTENMQKANGEILFWTFKVALESPCNRRRVAYK